MSKPSIYHISVCETLCKTVSVYAESEDAALELVRDRYRTRDIELFADDLDGTDFDVLDHEDDADPANADYNAVAPASVKPAGDDADEDAEPPAVGDVLAVAAREPESRARAVQELFPLPCGTMRQAVRDAPMYARDDAGRLLVCEQPIMF